MTAKKTAPKKPAAASSAPKKPRAPKAAPKGKVMKPVSPVGAVIPAAKSAKPAVVNAPQPVVMGPPMRKKEIIEQVVLRSGLKKRDVKPVLDHLLSVMGDAMADNRELVVPPFGRFKTHKKKEAAKKTIYFSKVHQSNAPKPPATPSDPAE